MARKDAGLMMEEASRGKSELTAIPAIASEMDRWMENGHSNDDWTVIANGNEARNRSPIETNRTKYLYKF